MDSVPQELKDKSAMAIKEMNLDDRLVGFRTDIEKAIHQMIDTQETGPYLQNALATAIELSLEVAALVLKK